jgi:hypothetical protein
VPGGDVRPSGCGSGLATPDLAPALRGLNNTNLDRLARQLAKGQQTADVAIARELTRRVEDGDPRGLPVPGADGGGKLIELR